MPEWLYRWFAPPQFPDDEKKTRRAGLVNAVLLVSIGSLVFFIVAGPIMSPELIPRVGMAIMSLMVTLGLWYLLHRGYVNFVSIIFIIITWTTSTMMPLTGQGLRDPGFANYALLMLGAGFMVGRRAAIGVIVMSILSGLVMLYAENIGYLPRMQYDIEDVWINYVIYLLMGFGVLVLVLQNHNNALEKAHREIAKRRKIEESLRRANTIVEHSKTMLVRWRTDDVWKPEYVSENVRQFGVTSAQLMKGEVNFRDLVHPEDLAHLEDLVREKIAIHDTQFQLEYRVKLPGDRVVWIEEQIRMDYANQVGEGILNDITERKQAEARRMEAERLRLELAAQKDLIEMKEQFIANVSHEFRTPLSVILSSRDMLMHYYDRLTAEKRLEHLEKIGNQCAFMVDMLDRILFIRRTNAGMTDFKPHVFPLMSLCRQVIERQNANNPDSKRIVLQTSLPDSATLYADPQLLYHILSNVLSNALKYSPDDAPVYLEIDQKNGSTLMKIRDTGIGIPEAAQKHLFEPFHRADNVGNVDGNGLGLSIVKESVNLHGGTITIDSTEGAGTTVTICLPGAPDEPMDESEPESVEG